MGIHKYTANMYYHVTQILMRESTDKLAWRKLWQIYKILTNCGRNILLPRGLDKRSRLMVVSRVSKKSRLHNYNCELLYGAKF